MKSDFKGIFLGFPRMCALEMPLSIFRNDICMCLRVACLLMHSSKDLKESDKLVEVIKGRERWQDKQMSTYSSLSRLAHFGVK